MGEKEFDALWQTYPNKDGRKAALKHFLATVVTPQDLTDITTALTHYLASERVKNGFVKNGSTFFNNWRDWVSFDGARPETQAERDKRIIAEIRAK